MNNWTQCPAGELDRLEVRLKALQQIQTLGTSAAAIVLSAIIAVATWTAIAAVSPVFTSNTPGAGAHETGKSYQRELPRPGEKEDDEGPNFPQQEDRDQENAPPADGQDEQP